MEQQDDIIVVTSQSYFWIEPAGWLILAAYFVIPNLLLVIYQRVFVGR